LQAVEELDILNITMEAEVQEDFLTKQPMALMLKDIA
jgi:hypothetical protein